MLTAIFNLGFLLALAIGLAVCFRQRLLLTLPAAFCAVGLVLYALAFLGRLGWIDGVSVLGLALLAALLVYALRQKGKELFLRETKRLFCDPALWISIALCAIVLALVQYRTILEWDALNFWGPDVKSLFFRGGFAPKYSNAASNFGDYPPACQLIIWWFLHLGGVWNEGMVFGGYLVFGAVLLFGFVGMLTERRENYRLPVALIACIAVLLLPGVADTSWYRSIYMDPIMALLFGSLLYTAVRRDADNAAFCRLTFVVYTAFLTLTKSIGILWAVLAVVFALWWRGRADKTRYRAILLPALLAIALPYGSWELYCKAFDRATRLTESLNQTAGAAFSSILNGTFLSTGNNRGYLQSFVRAFFLEPVHTGLSLTPALLVLLVLLAAVAVGRLCALSKSRRRALLSFCILTYIVVYLMLLIGHLTMFYSETQYLQSSRMIVQMTRYGAPANLGLLMLLGAVLSQGAMAPVQNGQRKRFAAWCAAAALVFGFTAYGAALDCFVEGHDSLNPQRIALREERTARYATFLHTIEPLAADLQQEHCRVLLASSADTDIALAAPTIGLNASPVSVVVVSTAEQDEATVILDRLTKSQAGYLYVADCADATRQTLGTHLEDGGTFQTGQLYRIDWQGGQLQLTAKGSPA